MVFFSVYLDRLTISLSSLDPEDLGLPVLRQPLHFYKDPTQAPEILHKINKKIKEADAYILISAEYNRTIPPALSNTLNHFPPPRCSFFKFLFINIRILVHLIWMLYPWP